MALESTHNHVNILIIDSSWDSAQLLVSSVLEDNHFDILDVHYDWSKDKLLAVAERIDVICIDVVFIPFFNVFIGSPEGAHLRCVNVIVLSKSNELPQNANEYLDSCMVGDLSKGLPDSEFKKQFKRILEFLLADFSVVKKK